MFRSSEENGLAGWVNEEYGPLALIITPAIASYTSPTRKRGKTRIPSLARFEVALATLARSASKGHKFRRSNKLKFALVSLASASG